MKYLLSVLLIIFCLAVEAQSLPWNQLQINQQLPENLLNGRTAVLIQTPSAGITQQQPWQLLAQKIHPKLRAMGIDPVAYYDYHAVDAGPDVLTAFSKTFRERAIDQLMILQKNGSYTLTLLPLGKEEIFDVGAQAWQQKAATPELLMNSLQSALQTASLREGNLLILEVPEFYGATPDFTIKRRFFSYPPDLKLDKFAVPAYGLFQTGDSLQEVRNIMQAYPFAWGITELGTSEENLRLKQGYQFVLLYMQTQPSNIRKYLQYPDEGDATLEQAPSYNAPEVPMYKFYIRHIYSGEVYTGTYWDADPEWRVALRNFVQGLNRELASQR